MTDSHEAGALPEPDVLCDCGGDYYTGAQMRQHALDAAAPLVARIAELEKDRDALRDLLHETEDKAVALRTQLATEQAKWLELYTQAAQWRTQLVQAHKELRGDVMDAVRNTLNSKDV
jgi:hypothetical protein